MSGIVSGLKVRLLMSSARQCATISVRKQPAWMQCGRVARDLAAHSARSMVTVTQTKSTEFSQQNLSMEKIGQDVPLVGKSGEGNKSSDSMLTVTPSCIQRIERLVEQRTTAGEDESERYYLRVYVDAGGCSGFVYKFEIDSEELDKDDDIVVHYAMDADGNETIPRLVVDQTSMDFIRGSTIDYVQEMIKSSFEVTNNPQSESACGCGSSFAVKNFSANPAID